MILADVMDQLGDRLRTISGLHVHAYEADDIVVPGAIISLPMDIDYLGTYENGMHNMTFVLSILMSSADDRLRRDQITPYVDSHGPQSVIQILECPGYTAFDFAVVARAGFVVVEIAKVDYDAALFTVNVSGSGR